MVAIETINDSLVGVASTTRLCEYGLTTFEDLKLALLQALL